MIFLDIAMLLRRRRGEPPNGITRVELNLAPEFIARGGRLVRYDEVRGQFLAMPDDGGRHEVTALLQTCRVARKRFLHLPAWRLRFRLLLRANDPLLTAWFLAYNFEFLSINRRLAIVEQLRIFENPVLADNIRYWLFVERKFKSPVPPLFVKGDVVVLPGLAWIAYDWEMLEALVQDGVRVVGIVFDIIPISHPHLTKGAVEKAQFEAFLKLAAKSGLDLVSISRFVAADVGRYFLTKGYTKQIRANALASTAFKPGFGPSNLGDDDATQGRYVLLASSIQARKNQAWFLRVWRSLTRPWDKTRLILAGQLYDAAYLDDLQRSEDWSDDIRFVADPSDALMAALYAGCLFTVFPSQAEGWGLPISESLAHGKYCLSADNTSLPEAGQGLTFCASLDRPDEWKAELERLLSDADYLDMKTGDVRRNFTKRSWSDVVAGMLAPQ